MLRFIVLRLIWMVPSLIAVSFLAFVLIQLPPGDYVTTYIATLAASNEVVDQNTAADLRARFGLDQPMAIQYLKWIAGILTEGNFGLSFEWQQPVSELIWERMALTLVLTVSTLIVTWGIASAHRRVLGREEIFGRRLCRDVLQLSSASRSRASCSRSCLCTSRQSSSGRKWAGSFPSAS